MNAKWESRLPGFRTYAGFFEEAIGPYKAVRSSRTQKRQMIRLLSKIKGEPKDLIEGAREDMLSTVCVREVRKYESGRNMVRYEVRPLMDDCSWDSPQQLLTLWDEHGELIVYTFVYGTGRDGKVAANLHVEHGGEKRDQIVYETVDALGFLNAMEPGDSMLVGNDDCSCEFMVVSNDNGVPRVSLQVFADAWWMNSVGDVSWGEAETAVRTFWKNGVIGVQELFDWEPADPWDENTGKRTIHVARELRRALMRSIRQRDKVLEGTLRYFGIAEEEGVKTLDLAVGHGEWKDMMLALDREWSNLYQIWSSEDRAKLCLYLAIENVGGADRDIASYFDEEFEGKKNDAYDFAKMVYWQEKGAKTGDVICQRNAGYLFRSADGLKHNGHRAVYWFEKAAAQKDANSMRALATCLDCGRCVKKDTLRAEALRSEAGALEEKDENVEICDENGETD